MQGGSKMVESVLIEAGAPTPAVPQQQEAMSCKHRSPLFAGPGGELYLRKLLRHILPAALYRTWEIFAEHQAQGNECFLSLTQLAPLAGCSLRTIQKGMAPLQAMELFLATNGKQSISR